MYKKHKRWLCFIGSEELMEGLGSLLPSIKGDESVYVGSLKTWAWHMMDEVRCRESLTPWSDDLLVNPSGI